MANLFFFFPVSQKDVMSYQLKPVAEHMDHDNLKKYADVEEIPEHLKKPKPKPRQKWFGLFSQQNAESALV